MENRSIVAGSGGGVLGVNTKGEKRERENEEVFLGDRTTLYLDFGSSYMNLHIVENYQKKGGDTINMLIKNVFYVYSNYFLLKYLRGLLKLKGKT